jgi:hypothetical protein
MAILAAEGDHRLAFGVPVQRGRGAQIEVEKPETAALVVSTERSYADPSRPADARVVVR